VINVAKGRTEESAEFAGSRAKETDCGNLDSRSNSNRGVQTETHPRPHLFSHEQLSGCHNIDGIQGGRQNNARSNKVTKCDFGRFNGPRKSRKTNKIISQDGNRTRTPLVGTQDFKSCASAYFATWPWTAFCRVLWGRIPELRQRENPASSSADSWGACQLLRDDSGSKKGQ
jgi:hypothetical protein